MDKNPLERSGPQYTGIHHSCCEAFVTKLIIREDAIGRDDKEWIQFISNLQNLMSPNMGSFILPAIWVEGINVELELG